MGRWWAGGGPPRASGLSHSMLLLARLAVAMIGGGWSSLEWLEAAGLGEEVSMAGLVLVLLLVLVLSSDVFLKKLCCRA